NIVNQLTKIESTRYIQERR
ncbi:hypothetical protein Zm00014a_042324, partial [Zea mays]